MMPSEGKIFDEAESSIAYLKQQVAASPLADLRNLFYELIQSQTETMMLGKCS